VHYADEGLARGEAGGHLLPERLLLHPGDEVAHHRQRDVGFQQRHTHLAQRFLDVGIGETRFAADRLDDARER